MLLDEHSLDDHAGGELEDLFGVRGALESLPASHRDQFLDDWYALAEPDAEHLVAALYARVSREAHDRTVRDGADDLLAGAWRQVSEAMTRYLAWRSH
jgi:hypothetical protein